MTLIITYVMNCTLNFREKENQTTASNDDFMSGWKTLMQNKIKNVKVFPKFLI